MSIICVMRSMPSVVTFSTWVSPRLNSAEPCARFSTPTSADSGRMSVGPRPSRRTPSSITRLAHDLLLQLLPRGAELAARARGVVAEAWRPGAPWPRPSARRASPHARPCRARWPRPAGPSRTRDSASYRSSPKSGRGVHACRVTPTASMNSCWNSITSAIARLAASRPSATVSSVGAGRAVGEQVPGVVGRLALDHQDVDLAGRRSGGRRRPRRTWPPRSRWNVGLTTHCPSISAMRTEATGPSNGRPARQVATDAAFIAGMS